MYMHTSRGRDNAYVKRVTMSLLGSMSAGVIVLLSSPLTHCLFEVTVPRLGTSFALGPPKRPFAPTHSVALSLSQLHHAESCPPDRTQAYPAAQSYHQPCRRVVKETNKVEPPVANSTLQKRLPCHTAYQNRRRTRDDTLRSREGAGSATPQLLGE